MDMPRGKTESLTADDWTQAALDALARGGLAAVAVEPLAKELGATKGSFYWHFADRDALVKAALARWEREETTEVLAMLDAIADPTERMGRVLRSGFVGRLGGSVDAALLADSGHPLVAPVLRRVTAARLRYTTAAFRAMGFRGRAAQERALLAYAAYVGHFALQRAAPTALPRGTGAASYVDHVVATLLAKA
jgi:AcrR family transcriptional regulator